MRADASSVDIAGIGFWSSWTGNWAASRSVLRGEAPVRERPLPKPMPPWLAPNERRRAPDSVAIALTVAKEACDGADAEPASVTSVFASTYGDLPISDAMCATLARDPHLTSPTRFHNSVHNAAAGYFSIATGSHAPTTAIAAHDATFGAGLLEALTQCTLDQVHLLYVAYDVEATGPLASVVSSTGRLGCAVLLTPAARTDGRSKARLTFRVAAGTDAEPFVLSGAQVLAQNALAPCLPFAAALAAARPATLAIRVGGSLRLHVDLEFADAAA